MSAQADAEPDATPASTYGPVSDWATDLDHVDPAYNRNAPAIWRELVDGGCPSPTPIATAACGRRSPTSWSRRSPTTPSTSRAAAVVVSRAAATTSPEAPIGGAPPITSDPPFHHHARRLLLPPFAPKKIEPWEHEVRTLCRDASTTRSAGTPRHASMPRRSTPSTSRSTVIGRCSACRPRTTTLFREFVHDVLEAVDVEPERARRRLRPARRLPRRADRATTGRTRATT